MLNERLNTLPSKTRMKQAVEAESYAWASGLDRPMSLLASTVCALATDCTPHPAQPTLSPTDAPMVSHSQTQVLSQPSLNAHLPHPTFMLLFSSFGLPTHELTLSTTPPLGVLRRHSFSYINLGQEAARLLLYFPENKT